MKPSFALSNRQAGIALTVCVAAVVVLWLAMFWLFMSGFGLTPALH